MKLRLRLWHFIFFLSTSSISFAQMSEYNYNRPLEGLTNQWHQIILPNEIFSKTNQNLSDIRIYGITQQKDTIEAPYLLEIASNKLTKKDILFKEINTSYNKSGYYFTFEVPTLETINELNLQFMQLNFDWRITLEGSQDLDEWFTILDNYRIVAVNNNYTNYQFTKLLFENSKYKYYRVKVKSKKKPLLKKANISKNNLTKGNYRSFKSERTTIVQNKKAKQTEIEIELKMPSRISSLKIQVLDSFDYYRPIEIKYLYDSLQTENGWKYNYRKLGNGTLNSIEKNEFKFNSKTVSKLKILIVNNANQPLKIGDIEVRGFEHKLIARFIEEASYFLTYGNQNARKPRYDIARFTKNIPSQLNPLQIGAENKNIKLAPKEKSPLFKNKYWLWGIMIIIVITLLGFSLKMIGKNSTES